MIRRIAIGSMMFAGSLCSIAAACPMCRDSAAIGGGGVAATGGSPPAALFNASILCILGGFLVVLGLVVAKIVSAIRLANRSAMEQNGTERNTVFVSRSGR